MSTEQSYAPGTHPDLPPPASEIGVYGWIRHNLLSSTTNIVVTVVTIYLTVRDIAAVVELVFLRCGTLRRFAR